MNRSYSHEMIMTPSRTPSVPAPSDGSIASSSSALAFAAGNLTAIITPRFAPELPIELWTIIFGLVTAPLTQFVFTPAAATSALEKPTEIASSRANLLQLAHVNKAAYMAARPFIYGTLSIAFRETAAHDWCTRPMYPPLPAEAFKGMPELARYDNFRYMVDRERIAAASRVIPGWCGAAVDKACSKAHSDRDQRIAQVTEVPEVFPFVVLDGKLFLASLASNEQALDSVGEDDLVEVIKKSATCLLVDDYDDTESNSASSASVEVKIINGLVLVQYPLHLVTTLYLHTGIINLLHCLGAKDDAVDTAGPKFDWHRKLPFLVNIPSQHVKTLSLTLSSDRCANEGQDYDTLCSDLLGQLLAMYPHVSTLDVISTHPSPCPPRFAPNLQSAYVFQDGLFHDQDIIPMTLAHWPRLRHLGLHGNHSYCHKAWYALVNHPALQTLVTDFQIHSFASGCVPMRAPVLTSWTTSNYVLGFMFDLASAEPCWDSGDMFTALEDLKLVVDVWSTEAMMGRPGHNSEIPPIPYSRIGSRLRTFEVVESVRNFLVWTHISLEALAEVIALPHLEKLRLGHVHPLSDSVFPSTVTCANLTDLTINIELFISILPFASFPRLTKLVLMGDYMPDPQHQFTQDLWLQIASSSFASQLVTFGLVQIPFSLAESSSFTFPPASPPLARLQNMLLLAKIGHVDVTHLPDIAPNLTQLDLDVDHVDGLPTLLAHPSLKLLLLTGVRCPTALEALLTHDFSSSHGPAIQLQRPLIGSMYMGSGESVVGSKDVCAREDMVLEYIRERTDVWRALASQDYVAMPQGNVAKVTLSVPRDVRVAESRVLVAAILRLVDGWKGMVFKVRLLGNRKSQRGGRSNVPHGVGVLVQGLRATPGLTRLLVQLNPSARWKVVHSGWKVGAFGKSRRRGLLAF